MLLEICLWISGYQGYQPNIRGVINGYQEKIYQISIKYLTDFGRILKITPGYTYILARYQWTMVGVKNLKNF